MPNMTLVLGKLGLRINYLQSVQHMSTGKGPYPCSPHTPSLAALQVLPRRIPGAVKDKDMSESNKCSEVMMMMMTKLTLE